MFGIIKCASLIRYKGSFYLNLHHIIGEHESNFLYIVGEKMKLPNKNIN